VNDLYLLTLVFDTVVLHDGPECGLSYDRRTAFVSADALTDDEVMAEVCDRLLGSLPDW
jgi:hypothetical protein